ncbi:MAG: bifunctional metallophosphatase/5'-nucleotidase [Planctomycetota bacterium]
MMLSRWTTAALVATLTVPVVVPAVWAGPVTLTLLHNNDGESDILSNDPRGSAANFSALVGSERADANAAGHFVLTLSSGDNILPGPEFNASLATGDLGSRTYFDANVLNAIGYDAIAIGNHDFDFGPTVLADFIPQVNAPLVSANLDFSDNAGLQNLKDAGEIAESVLVSKTVDGVTRSYGVIGATTTDLASISSPGNVDVLGNVAELINAEAADLRSQGAEQVILVSHLQGIGVEIDLIGELSGVDVTIAGGGSELLANPDAVLLPGDTPAGPYPLQNTELDGSGVLLTDADGNVVPVVTTSGNYNYLGRLDLTYDDTTGELLSINGNPIANFATGPVDAEVQANAVDPVETFVADLATRRVATIDITLFGNADRDFLRAREVPLGNLFADSYLFAIGQLQEQGLLDDFGVELDNPLIALQNSGGIRASFDPGDLTVLDTFSAARFTNIVGIVKDVDPETLLDLLEAAVSRTALDPATGQPVQGPSGGTGRFAQIGGFSIVYDINAQQEEQPDDDGNPRDLDGDGVFGEKGLRIVSVQLADGTYIVKDGFILADAPDVDIATIDFLFGGGDQYDFGDSEFFSLGLTYQQAFEQYLRFLDGETNGDPITGLAAYDALFDPDGRITLGTQVITAGTARVIPTPTAALAGLLGIGLLAARRRRAG